MAVTAFLAEWLHLFTTTAIAEYYHRENHDNGDNSKNLVSLIYVLV